MINCTQQTNSYAYKEWAEAYIDLQEDELLQLFVLFLNRNKPGRRLLELSRQIWREHGLNTAPFDAILFEAKAG